MGFRRILSHWRSATPRHDGYSELPPQSTADGSRNLYLEPLLDLSAMTITRTWRDLPQEIVDRIIFMLRNDLKSLKGCSLTCKTMFFSARSLIHWKIYLTREHNWEVLTIPEMHRYINGDRRGIAVKMLSGIASCGLFPYARHLYIHINENFTPANLQPFNNHFQRFHQIQELSIYWLHTPDFLEQFDDFFPNFVPTLRSLHLDMPTGDSRDILDFICRFPHLNDLSFRISPENSINWDTWKSPSLPAVKKIPPFRGRLKLCGIGEWHGGGYIVQQLISLHGKRRFRFIDFRSCPSDVERHVIDAFSGTIETVSTTWQRFREKGLPLNLTSVTNLRSLTLRVDFEAIRHPYKVLSRTLYTITSPFFSEFILEVECISWNIEPAYSARISWGTWTELDKMFEEIDVKRGFTVVIRAEKVDDNSNFIAQAKDRLALMDARGRLVFEIGPFPEK